MTLSSYAAKKASLWQTKLLADLKALITFIKRRGTFKTALEASMCVARENNESIPRQAIIHAFHRNELHCYGKPLKPCLISHHVKKRFKWARDLKDRSLHYWENIIFTDESKHNLYGPGSALKVWRHHGSQLQHHHTRQAVKYGGGPVMAWEAVTPRGWGNCSL